MCRLSDAELNCVSTKMRRMSACRQLLIGMSISRYLPPIGTAGFERVCGQREEARALPAAEDDRQRVSSWRIVTACSSDAPADLTQPLPAIVIAVVTTVALICGVCTWVYHGMRATHAEWRHARR